MVSIVGGKLTTYRRMAQDTVDVLNRLDGLTPLHPTQNLLLHGSLGWPDLQHNLAVKGTAWDSPHRRSLTWGTVMAPRPAPSWG